MADDSLPPDAGAPRAPGEPETGADGDLGEKKAGPRIRRPPFELEGRAAPGLYAAGWVLSTIGLAAAFVGLAASQPVTTPLLFGLGMMLLALGLGSGAGSQALQRRADGVARYAGPMPVLVFAAAATAGLGAQSLVILVVGPSGLPDAVALAVSSGTMAVAAVAAVAILVVGAGALRWREMGLLRLDAGRGSAVTDLAWGVTLAVPTLFLAGAIAVVLVGLLGVMPEPVLPLSPDPAVLLVSLAVAGLVAPLWEELFFRGFATTAWTRAVGPRAAIVRGAVFFALIHVLTITGGDFGTAARVALIAFCARLPVGFVLGWVFLRRRSLLAPIALHATYNALPILLYVATRSALPAA